MRERESWLQGTENRELRLASPSPRYASFGFGWDEWMIGKNKPSSPSDAISQKTWEWRTAHTHQVPLLESE